MLPDRQECGTVCRLIVELTEENPDRDRLAYIFDRVLTGTELREVKDEMVKILGEGRTDFETMIGDAMPQVLEYGFRRYPVERLVLLIRNPGCYLGLQEKLFVDGGEYWLDLANEGSDPDALRRNWEAIREKLEF